MARVGDCMENRYSLRCAVFLILTKIENGKEFVLLQRRYNTGLLDGEYDVSCAGHVEQGESLTEAMIRETQEEIGLIIDIKELHYSSTIHAVFEESEYVLSTFYCNIWRGKPKILELDKCDNLEWFSIDELPENLVDTRKIMIDNYKKKNLYSEYGFNKHNS